MTYYTSTLKHRAQPTSDWIKQIRKRFPIEKSLDDVLTRKLENRSKPVDHLTDFSNLETLLNKYLKNTTSQADLKLENLARLSGGASKEQFTFDLTWEQSSGEQLTRKLILRMDPSESIVETHRLREAQLLQAMFDEVPVPEVFWVDPTPDNLGYPFLIAGFLEGTVQPEGGDRASGLGMYFEPDLRLKLKDQFVRHLATIHTFDLDSKNLSSFDVPKSNSMEGNTWALGLWERIWNEDALEDHPVMEYAANWLKENMPIIEKPVVVHGDYRSGNFMYTDQGEINGILDWELAHIGDYHEDLAYINTPILGCADEKGEMLVSGLMPREEFLAKYEQQSGLSIDKDKLFYFEVLTYYKMSVIAVATSLRAAYGRKTHLDAMMNLLSGFGYVGISQLQRILF